MRNKNALIIVGVVIVIIVLLVLPKFSKQNQELQARLDAAGAECLAQGHTNLAQHIHPELSIIVDGVSQTIPANIGISNTCMAELHTHDTTGKIHIETLLSSKTFTLKDFFAMWDEPFDKPGYTMTMTVDGKPSSEGGELILKDLQQIVLTYTK